MSSGPFQKLAQGAPSETRFDAWVASEKFPRVGLLSEDEIAGLRLFLGEGECVNCHNGPLLTDNHFHNTGVPGLPEDLGRASGAVLVRQDPFNCLGAFSDAAPEQCAELRRRRKQHGRLAFDHA